MLTKRDLFSQYHSKILYSEVGDNKFERICGVKLFSHLFIFIQAKPSSDEDFTTTQWSKPRFYVGIARPGAETTA